jgi:acetylornithine deacetylase
VPDRALDLLRAMIAVDSVNTAISGRPAPEAAVVDLVADVATSWGLSVRRLPVPGHADDLLVTPPWERGATARATAPWLLLECHLDTVGVAGMAIDPFAAVVADGRVHGRGACDAKGAAAAMLVALREHVAAGAPGDHRVALLCTVDEEVGRAGIDAFVEHHLSALDEPVAGAVVGEPTGLRVVSAHTGVVRATIRTTGVAAHSSDPSRGRSAIRAMLPVLAALEARYVPGIAASHPLTGRAVASVNLIRGGEAVNMTPATCEVELDRRVAPGERPDEVIGALEALLDEVRATDPSVDVTLRDPVVHLPLDPAAMDGAGEALARAVGEALACHGLPAQPVGVGFGTDAGALAAAGIPSVVLGPGDIAQAHAADEWLALAQLDAAVALYRDVLALGPPAPPARRD